MGTPGLNDKFLKRSFIVKYLGLLIDDTLNWSSHIQHLSHQLARLSGIFYRLHNYVKKETLCMVYHSLVSSRIQYGITRGGNLAILGVRVSVSVSVC